MNKTLYIKEADLPIWEQAEKMAPNGVSQLVLELLGGYVVHNRPPTDDGFERIEVDTQASDEQPTIRKAFTGRWLVHPNAQFRAAASESAGVQWDSTDTTYAVAQTKKGKVVVYIVSELTGNARLNIYANFESFRHEPYPENLIAIVAEALGRPYVVDLDI